MALNIETVSYPTSGSAARPAKGTGSLYPRLLGYLKPYRKEFLCALAAMIVFGASDGAVPFLVKYVLDEVFQANSTSLLIALPIIVIGFTAIRAAADFAQQFLMSKVGLNIVKDIRNQLNHHLLGLSADFFAFRSAADLVTRVTSDVLLIRTLLTDAFASIIRDSIRVVALLAAAIYLDPTLALFAVLGFPLGIYPVYRFGRRMRRLSRVGQDSIGRLSALMQESVLGNRVVKIFGREAYERQCFEKENQELTKTFVKAERIRALTGPVNEVLASVAVSGVVLYGAYSVMHNFRSQGEFLAFLVSVFLLYDPFKKLSRVSSVVQQGLAGAERLFEVLDAESTVQEVSSPIPLNAESSIQFEGVQFSYYGDKSSEQLALSDIDLEIGSGKKVALVGLSGSGKSTLVDLIPRFIDPEKGRVKIGGVDISKVKISELRARIAMVSQHTFLFHDTVYNNILYGRETATREEVLAAAKAAFAYDFVTQLPQGFETMLGESGFTLSGGERQRIAIARAILKNAPILILDEATASLDNRSEREVQAALTTLEKGRTTVVIAHRLSTVKDADLIVVLKDGRIVETGTHQDLLSRNGEFSHLYRLQFDTPQVVGNIQ